MADHGAQSPGSSDPVPRMLALVEPDLITRQRQRFAFPQETGGMRKLYIHIHYHFIHCIISKIRDIEQEMVTRHQEKTQVLEEDPLNDRNCPNRSREEKEHEQEWHRDDLEESLSPNQVRGYFIAQNMEKSVQDGRILKALRELVLSKLISSHTYSYFGGK